MGGIILAAPLSAPALKTELLRAGDRLLTLVQVLSIDFWLRPCAEMSISFLFLAAVNCPLDTSDSSVTWSQTLSGTTANSSCNSGYYSSLTPQRPCTQSQANGVWGTAINPCNGF